MYPAKSTIDSQLTDQERQVLATYRDPARSGIGHAARLSIQYALGTGILLVLASGAIVRFTGNR